MFKTTGESLVTHKFNPKCECSKCFFKEIMNKSGATYEQILASLEGLQAEGVLEIRDYDSTGFPTEIKRIMPKKKIKLILSDLNANVDG